MDEFKPEDELKPDPSDRRTGRSRQSSERDNEPQINFDDVDLDADDRRPSRSRNAHEERAEEDYESEEDSREFQDGLEVTGPEDDELEPVDAEEFLPDPADDADAQLDQVKKQLAASVSGEPGQPEENRKTEAAPENKSDADDDFEVFDLDDDDLS